MNDFEINTKCKKCGSSKVTVKAIDRYDGDIVLSFTCDECNTTETCGVLDETE